MPEFASSRKALGICDVCGWSYKLSKLKPLVNNRAVTNILACPECWNPDHPQNHLGEVRVFDPQALRNPRTDQGEFAKSRAIIIPVTSAAMRISIGTVTVTTT